METTVTPTLAPERVIRTLEAVKTHLASPSEDPEERGEAFTDLWFAIEETIAEAKAAVVASSPSESTADDSADVATVPETLVPIYGSRAKSLAAPSWIWTRCADGQPRLIQAKSSGGEWRTIEGDQRIFITSAGEVRAGGPNGPVISTGTRQSTATTNPSESERATGPTTKPKPETPSFTGKSEIAYEPRNNVTQRQAAGVLRRALGSRYKEMILRVSGAPDGSQATYSLERYGGKDVVSVRYRNSELGIVSNREIYLEDRKIYNSYLSIDKRHQGKGTGTAVLHAQVRNAARLGFKQIECLAARGDMNGYYTWPRLGYDGNLSDGVKSRLARDFGPESRFETVSDLMAKPETRAWWKENGSSFSATFDLTPNSRSRKVLSNYARAKQRTATKS